MTWVIGMPGLMTRGVLVGDVRITLLYEDGRKEEVEGVRKVHAVAPNIAMGFAGNIDGCLKAVGDFATFMRLSVPEGHATTEPSRAIFKWARRARYGWANHLGAAERDGGCELIFIAARPPNGPFTPTVGYVLRAPNFIPEVIPAAHARSIGSGSGVAEYRSELELLANDHEIWQFETMYWDHIGGAGMAVTMAISEAIDKHAVPGISQHLHLCSVRFGEIQIGANDRVALTPGVESRIMPPVVESWSAWNEWKRTRGLANLVAVG